MPPDDSIEALMGEEINAICFVMDYVEIHFNGPILRCLASPVLEVQGKIVQFPSPGSRDTLCSLIGDVVDTIEVRDDIAITLRLKSGSILKIPLDWASRPALEAAHFVPGTNRPLQIW